MICSLEINNLKCIKNMQMECRNLNVLIGTNSSGKSTIQQALLLVGQNLETVEGINGKLVEFFWYALRGPILLQDKYWSPLFLILKHFFHSSNSCSDPLSV